MAMDMNGDSHHLKQHAKQLDKLRAEMDSLLNGVSMTMDSGTCDHHGLGLTLRSAFSKWESSVDSLGGLKKAIRHRDVRRMWYALKIWIPSKSPRKFEPSVAIYKLEEEVQTMRIKARRASDKYRSSSPSPRSPMSIRHSHEEVVAFHEVRVTVDHQGLAPEISMRNGQNDSSISCCTCGTNGGQDDCLVM